MIWLVQTSTASPSTALPYLMRSGKLCKPATASHTLPPPMSHPCAKTLIALRYSRQPTMSTAPSICASTAQVPPLHSPRSRPSHLAMAQSGARRLARNGHSKAPPQPALRQSLTDNRRAAHWPHPRTKRLQSCCRLVAPRLFPRPRLVPDLTNPAHTAHPHQPRVWHDGLPNRAPLTSFVPETSGERSGGWPPSHLPQSHHKKGPPNGSPHP